MHWPGPNFIKLLAENTAWQTSLLSKNWVGHLPPQQCKLNVILTGKLFLLSDTIPCLAECCASRLYRGHRGKRLCYLPVVVGVSVCAADAVSLQYIGKQANSTSRWQAVAKAFMAGALDVQFISTSTANIIIIIVQSAVTYSVFLQCMYDYVLIMRPNPNGL